MNRFEAKNWTLKFQSRSTLHDFSSFVNYSRDLSKTASNRPTVVVVQYLVDMVQRPFNL